MIEIKSFRISVEILLGLFDQLWLLLYKKFLSLLKKHVNNPSHIVIGTILQCTFISNHNQVETLIYYELWISLFVTTSNYIAKTES